MGRKSVCSNLVVCWYHKSFIVSSGEINVRDYEMFGIYIDLVIHNIIVASCSFLLLLDIKLQVPTHLQLT